MTIFQRFLLSTIGFYQRFVSPFLAPRCRFHPSCSSYAIEAIARYGAVAGAARAVRRLARCHPWHEGGYDPVDTPATAITPSKE